MLKTPTVIISVIISFAFISCKGDKDGGEKGPAPDGGKKGPILQPLPFVQYYTSNTAGGGGKGGEKGGATGGKGNGTDYSIKLNFQGHGFWC